MTGKPLGDGVLMATVVGGLSGGVGKFASEQLLGRAASAATGAATDAADTAEQDAASAARGAACGLSFSADTQVTTPSGARPISSPQVGDAVAAYDPATGKSSTQTVQQVFVNHDSDRVDVTLRTTTSGASTPTRVVGADDVPTRAALQAARQHQPGPVFKGWALLTSFKKRRAPAHDERGRCRTRGPGAASGGAA